MKEQRRDNRKEIILLALGFAVGLLSAIIITWIYKGAGCIA